eukprot:CAMPEP_0181227440 /NCGR_PEP_ID=MMETSP1096-20121128/32789_1 /TAXON_ID=156174 ORGANISM="Chrysochromulina ericina, Strain CCMP281" /NCGR_SAMPLE_ID=MMETSP1096 /ASSEMBLY_ACC=CAM_ASM_000453 /LENGTH=293 /DNA_ID=CAMNT_0023320845 /DNA_START=341 /DNA_END=1224 /DNA_ORIENTATION=-
MTSPPEGHAHRWPRTPLSTPQPPLSRLTPGAHRRRIKHLTKLASQQPGSCLPYLGVLVPNTGLAAARQRPHRRRMLAPSFRTLHSLYAAAPNLGPRRATALVQHLACPQQAVLLRQRSEVPHAMVGLLWLEHETQIWVVHVDENVMLREQQRLIQFTRLAHIVVRLALPILQLPILQLEETLQPRVGPNAGQQSLLAVSRPLEEHSHQLHGFVLQRRAGLNELGTLARTKLVTSVLNVRVLVAAEIGLSSNGILTSRDPRRFGGAGAAATGSGATLAPEAPEAVVLVGPAGRV